MPLVYDITFNSPDFAGQSAVVRDLTGATVTGSPVTLNASGNGQIVLDEGYYKATASNAALGLNGAVTNCVLNVPDSIEADSGGGDGTVEYARFIGTGAGDSSGDEFPVTFVADPNYDPVDWATAAGGEIVIDGPVVGKMIYRYVARLDFSESVDFSTANRAPDTDATVKFSRDGADFGANAGGPYYFLAPGAEGDVFDVDAVEEGITQTTRFSANNTLKVRATINMNGFNEAGEQISDGVLTGALAVWVTRLELPPAPTLD